MIGRRGVLIGMTGLCATAGWAGLRKHLPSSSQQAEPTLVPTGSISQKPFAPPSDWAAKLITAAEDQVGVTTNYDGAYVKLSYPGGDIESTTGVCTDVVIRAYRQAFNIDLQKLVHEDMKKAFSTYPSIWGLTRTDRNIDHRRVPNLERYFSRRKSSLAVTKNAKDYLPGDLVSQRLPGNLPHIAIVSHHANRAGSRPLIIHNIGRGTQVEDRLFDFNIVGHFRFTPDHV